MTSVRVVDEDGRICLETKAPSEPTALIETSSALDGAFVPVGLEAGPLSQWLSFGPTDAGLPAVRIETRRLKRAIGAMAVNRTDRNDARAIAAVVRSGWFKAVHVKSAEGQELRGLLSAREFLVSKVRDHENGIRGLLRPFRAEPLQLRVPFAGKTIPRIVFRSGSNLERLEPFGVGHIHAAGFAFHAQTWPTTSRACGRDRRPTRPPPAHAPRR